MSSAEDSIQTRIRHWDLAVACWIVVCLGLAGWVGVEVTNLRSLTETLVSSSRALEATSAALGQLEGTPLVGDDIGAIAQRLDETAMSARTQAAGARTTINRLAVLIAVAIVVIAVVPPLVAYLAVRRTWRRRTAP